MGTSSWILSLKLAVLLCASWLGLEETHLGILIPVWLGAQMIFKRGFCGTGVGETKAFEALFCSALTIQLKSHLWKTYQPCGPNTGRRAALFLAWKHVHQRHSGLAFRVIWGSEGAGCFGISMTQYSLTLWEWFLQFLLLMYNCFCSREMELERACECCGAVYMGTALWHVKITVTSRKVMSRSDWVRCVSACRFTETPLNY